LSDDGDEEDEVQEESDEEEELQQESDEGGDADQDEGGKAHQDEGEAHQDEEAYEPDEEDGELGCRAGAVPKVYIRGPAWLPDRPIPLANRPIIQLEGLR
jgi:hypothetical protein